MHRNTPPPSNHLQSPSQKMPTFPLLPLFLLLLLLPLSSAYEPKEEKLTLLRLKSHWNNPPSLSSWSNTSNAPHCSWLGISCTSGHVTNVTLPNLGIHGGIPHFLQDLSNLTVLNLAKNRLTTFPPELGDLLNLRTLNLSSNPFHPKPLPPDFAALKNLTSLCIWNASLAGTLPEWIGGFTQLEHLDLSSNNLTGTIPDSIWNNLTNLKVIDLYHNDLHGSLPATIGALGLKKLHLASNRLNGSIPDGLEKLENLTELFLYGNNFSGEIPAGVGRMAALEDIRMFRNRLTGGLPSDLGKYSPLYNVEFSENQMSGKLPETLCTNGQLQYIALYSNNFTGRVPISLANCSTLKMVRLQKNHLSGEVPAGLWKLKELELLLLHDNELSGELPEELPATIQRLELQNNRFSGRIPRSAAKLQVLYADNNTFSGKLPVDLSELSMLGQLKLDGNRISGGIPTSISALKNLTTVTLSRNLLTGEIPELIGTLPVLNYLDLSVNQLSGEIPESFNKLKLNFLNLSINSLTGPIPASLRVGAFDQSFLLNPGLCSGTDTVLSGLPPCTGANGNGSGRGWVLILLVVVAILVAAIAMIASGFFVLRATRRRRSGQWPNWKMTPFRYVEFRDSDIVRHLVPENLVGSGGSGEVYRVPVKEGCGGEAVAVKKIWNGKKLNSRLQKEFLAEVEILGHLKHINVVKLLCCISNEDSKMLVYEYLQNGSLYNWLHGKAPVRARLDWPTRVDIAVGAARGLSYMHHDCQPPIVHWDVKSSNILLDANFESKIADFGLARILAGGIGKATTMSAVIGSFGYMAPECGFTPKVNEKVDVYSFGVVLLELTTGKQAHEGDRDRSLVDWAWRHFRRQGLAREIVDEDIVNPLWMEEIESVMRLGLFCTLSEPSSRPTMKDVLDVLLRCSSAARRGEEKEVRVKESGPLLQKVGGRSRRVKDGEDAGGREDTLVLVTCHT